MVQQQSQQQQGQRRHQQCPVMRRMSKQTLPHVHSAWTNTYRMYTQAPAAAACMCCTLYTMCSLLLLSSTFPVCNTVPSPLLVLLRAGFTKPVAQWVTTNLRPAPGSRQLRWTFDLDGIAEMYDSYEASSMWELLQQPPQGLSVDFVRAERSSFRWEGGVVENLQALGHRVHLLRDAGHVVHQDNPGKQGRERPPGHSLE
jgi:hypothetical protein